MIEEQQDDGVVGVTLSAVAGLAAGLAAGLIVGEMLGAVGTTRLRGTFDRLRPRRERHQPDDVRRAVIRALRGDPRTHSLRIDVHAVDAGLLELTGTAPDVVTRQAAGSVARAVDGAEVIVNRILVEGSDVPSQPAHPREHS